MAATPASDSAPRFLQIVEHLRRDISDGKLAAHAALPSERSVAETHGVSRMTARRALERIEAEGLAYSAERRGRFVTPARLSYNISDRLGFTAHAEQSGVELDIDLVDAQTVAASKRQASQLGIGTGDLLYCYTRRFRVGGHTAFIETESVVADRFPDLLSHDLR
ncbi:MAG: GntR family transcriptional regulator, partial [Pseudomonadota bacterium]